MHNRSLNSPLILIRIRHAFLDNSASIKRVPSLDAIFVKKKSKLAFIECMQQVEAQFFGVSSKEIEPLYVFEPISIVTFMVFSSDIEWFESHRLRFRSPEE